MKLKCVFYFGVQSYKKFLEYANFLRKKMKIIVFFYEKWKILQAIPLKNEEKCCATKVGHLSACFQVGIALFVQFGPMATFLPGREALCQATIWQTFQRRVDPAEAQCLFHNIQVRQAYALGFVLSAVQSHPTAFCRCCIPLEPLPEL